MEIENKLENVSNKNLSSSIYKNIQRKKFFSTAGKGIVGLILVSTFPFKLFARKNEISSNSKKIKIKINPLAVSRNKIGGKNV